MVDYILKQLENSLRVKDPSKEFVKEVANSFMDYHLYSFLYGVKFERDHVERVKKIYEKAKADNVHPSKFAEYMNFVKYISFRLDEADFRPREGVWALSKGLGLDKRTARNIKKGLEKMEMIAELVYYDTYANVLKTLEGSIAEGETVKDWVKRVGKNDILKSVGLDKDSPWYLENVFRTNSTSAHNAGKHYEAKRNKNIAMFEFSSVLDGATTEQCQAYDGLIKPVDDDVWSYATPPLHYQCRSQLLSITELEVDALDIKPSEKLPTGTDEKGNKVSAKKLIPKDFQNNPAVDDKWLKPSPGMRKRVDKAKE